MLWAKNQTLQENNPLPCKMDLSRSFCRGSNVRRQVSIQSALSKTFYPSEKWNTCPMQWFNSLFISSSHYNKDHHRAISWVSLSVEDQRLGQKHRFPVRGWTAVALNFLILSRRTDSIQMNTLGKSKPMVLWLVSVLELLIAEWCAVWSGLAQVS